MTKRKPGLTAKQERFVAEYLVDPNASAAARRAGYKGDANTVGPRLLANVGIQLAIQAGREAVASSLKLSAERVISEAWRILIADPRELVEHFVGACRFCWGREFRYQRTAAEMSRDLAEEEAGRWAVESRRTGAPFPFDDRGGIGFNPNRAPNEACPECFGRGQGRTHVNDTRNLSPAAAALYAGIKQTKDGIEVKMHSKLDALERLCRHLGLYDKMKLPDQALTTISAGAATLADQGRAVLAAAVAGQLTAAQAGQLMSGLGTLAKLVETTELAARIAALERSDGAT